MILPQPISLFLRLLSVGLLGAMAFSGITSSSHWMVMISLSCLAALAVVRHVNVLLYWPIGLLTVIVTMYGAYWLQWLGNPVGVDLDSAQTLFTILAIMFVVVAAVRVVLQRDVVVIPSVTRIITVAVMATLPVVLVYLVTTRWGDEPVRLISGHLAGGDHGAHNEIVHRLLRDSGEVSYASPLQMYTYPQALHFMTANLVAFTQPTSTLPLLAQEYVMGAWVEWLQFAAFCQLAIVVFMKGARGSGLQRVLFLPPVMFVFAAMDNFIAHLLWSGFTTSLGITWLLLAFVAVSDRLFLHGSFRRARQSFAVLGFFAYASWIVYQPYAVIFLALIGFFALQVVGRWQRLARVMGPVSSVLERPLVVVLAVAGAVFAALIGILGSASPAVTSLLLDGATYQPYFYTVMLWAFLAMAGQWLLTQKSEVLGIDDAQMKFLFVHFGFVIGMIATVMWAGNLGLLEQPYYIQKMLWVLLFVSIPVALAIGFTWLEKSELQWPAQRRHGLLAVLTVVILLTPLVQGRAPVNATRKHNVDWFARGMTLQVQDEENRAVAFSWVDRLGTHLSNLALRSTSNLVMPVETGISGNTYLACRFINDNDATLIYSTPNGRAELVAAGCKTDATYIENGVVVENPPYRMPLLPVNLRMQTTATGRGFEYLIRGFLPPERWGTWAGGYRSAFGFRYPKDMASAILRVDLETHMVFGRGINVLFRVDGEIVEKLTMPRSGEINVQIPLGRARLNEQAEITIECERTDDQVLKDDPVDGPIPCVGLKSIELREVPL